MQARIVTLFTGAASPWIEHLRTRAGFDAVVRESHHASRMLATRGYEPTADPRSTDARRGCLERCAGEGWLAAGDAAAAYDPLGSYGILFSLHSGLRAAAAITAHDAGDRDAPVRYESAVIARFDEFLRERARHYAHERRWGEGGYWGKRGGGREEG